MKKIAAGGYIQKIEEIAASGISKSPFHGNHHPRQVASLQPCHSCSSPSRVTFNYTCCNTAARRLYFYLDSQGHLYTISAIGRKVGMKESRVYLGTARNKWGFPEFQNTIFILFYPFSYLHPTLLDYGSCGVGRLEKKQPVWRRICFSKRRAGSVFLRLCSDCITPFHGLRLRVSRLGLN